MYKKILSLFILIFSVITLNSCWIYPDYKDYKLIDGIYYFHDYETMKSVIIPEINKSFTSWHWNGDEFDKKWDKYFGNVSANSEDYQKLQEKGYSYAVRSPSSLSIQFTGNPSASNIGKCFWFTTKNNKGVIFYQK